MISNEKRDAGGNMTMVTTKRKIFVAECKQEVSTFNPVPSRYADFEICSGEDLLRVHQGRKMEMGGALKIFGDRHDVEIVPGYSARAVTSGGTLSAPDFEKIAAEFLTSVKSAKGVDGVYDSDPRTNPKATKFDQLTPADVLAQGLKVADATAISLCQDNDLPIVVFNLLQEGNIARAVRGEAIGTLISN